MIVGTILPCELTRAPREKALHAVLVLSAGGGVRAQFPLVDPETSRPSANGGFPLDPAPAAPCPVPEPQRVKAAA